jgi:hypothetical protein
MSPSTRRVIPWLAGFVGASACALAAGRWVERPEIQLIVLLASWLALGLLFDLIRGRSPGGETPGAERPQAIDRPADGRVEVVAVAGLEGEANPSDGRFRRFVAAAGPQPAGFAVPREPRATPSLRGEMVFVSLFVGRDGTAWTDGEIARAHSQLERAASWIEREALRWGAAVNVALAGTYFQADDPERTGEVALGESLGTHALRLGDHDAEWRALSSATRAAAGLGFRDLVDLVEGVRPVFMPARPVWLLHLRAAGTSMAVSPDVTPIPGLSLAICYAREANFPEPLAGPPFTDPIGVVHEVLHLFGATDKYDCSLARFPRGEVTERDVMVEGVSSLTRLRIDRLTAREIGWCP